MTPEEIKNTMEFLLQNAATFSDNLEGMRLQHQEYARERQEFAREQQEIARRHDQDHRHLVELTRQTARFEAMVMREKANAAHREVIHLLHRILDRLPPSLGR